MGGANGWTYLPTIRRSFPERERHDFTGHLQSVNTGFCIDRRARPFLAHRLFVRVIPIALLLIFLVAALWDPSTCMVDQQRGKSAKVLSLANCGMGAAVDIGVIREHVLGFLSMPLARRLRLSETNLFMQALGAIRLARRSGNSILRIGRFCWRICLGGGGSGGIPAQRIG